MNDRIRLANRKRSLMADQRGAVAFEMPFVYFFLMFSLLFPLADVGIAGFQYISAWQALRAFGQYLQYNPPADVTSTSSWSSSAVAKADPSYPVASIQVMCGDSSAACTATNTASPKYYSYTTTITLAPMVLKSVLCTSTNTNPCTYTLPYSERFQ
jgi:Flp pilus assembly protein TadG